MKDTTKRKIKRILAAYLGFLMLFLICGADGEAVFGGIFLGCPCGLLLFDLSQKYRFAALVTRISMSLVPIIVFSLFFICFSGYLRMPVKFLQFLSVIPVKVRQVEVILTILVIAGILLVAALLGDVVYREGNKDKSK